MAHYIPKIANNTTDLRCARKTGETVIVCTDHDFFAELDKKVTGDKVLNKTKKLGMKGLVAGAILSSFTAGLGLVVLVASALGTVAGVALEQFKDYNVVMDYEEKRVIFLKSQGKTSFTPNKDTIEGIDINKFIQKSDQS